MKIEIASNNGRKMSLLERLGIFVDRVLDSPESRLYAAQYRLCFKGTPDEVERKLRSWESTYETTKARTYLC